MKKKSVYDRLALKQKLAMVQKALAVQTLQEELDRTTSVRDQLATIIDDTAIKTGPSSAMLLRSANWYGGQIQEQLTTITNRTEILGEEVAEQRARMAVDRHRFNLANEKSEAHQRQLAEESEERAMAAMPARPSTGF